MSGIRSRGRRGSTNVPNWRWEDPQLDPYDLRVAGWLASHADAWREDNVGRNEIARCLNISGERVSKSKDALEALGIISVALVPNPKGGKERWVIDFHWDVWETDPQGRVATLARSCGDQQQGRVATSSIGEQDLEETNTRDDLFEVLWKRYPNKNAKKTARERWSKLSYANQLIAIESLPAWLENRDPQYAPYLQKWLSQHRWTDPPAPPRFPSSAPPRPGRTVNGRPTADF